MLRSMKRSYAVKKAEKIKIKNMHVFLQTKGSVMKKSI
jgi:hypothetical protein